MYIVPYSRGYMVFLTDLSDYTIVSNEIEAEEWINLKIILNETIA
jgi:hypothetical protein